MRHRSLIALGGTLWLSMGIFLLVVGINLTLQAIILPPQPLSPLTLATLFVKERTQAALLVITAGLYIGYLKGRFVLRRSAQKQIQRVLEKAEPLSLRDMYGPATFLLIAAMMGLGMLLRILPIAQDLRGFIDIAVGSALIGGATVYFRKMYERRAMR